MKKAMFLGAHQLVFENAKQLRKNLTDAEMKLWGYLKTRPLGYKFRRQHPIGIYVVDFYCHALQLFIEVDSSIHLLPEVTYDKERQRLLEDDAIEVIRFTNEEVLKQYEATIETINKRLQEMGNIKNSGSPKFPLQGAEGVA